MLITVSGSVNVFDKDGKEILPSQKLKKYDKLTCDYDQCSEYIDGLDEEIELQGGTIKLIFDSNTKRLQVITQYNSARMLKKEELKILSEQTQIQWNDGLGEGYFDDPEAGIFFNFGYDKKSISIEQVKGKEKRKRKRYSPIFSAMKSGNINKLKELIENGEDIKHVKRENQTPLSYAIFNLDDVDLAMFLIESGADVTGLISTASQRGDLKLLKKLISHGADVNELGGGTEATPAMWAANSGHIDILKELISAGCDLNKQGGCSNETTLMYTKPSRFDILELLLDHGADPNLRNKQGHTAAEEALMQAEQWNTEESEFAKKKVADHTKKAEFLKQYELD